MKKWGKDLIGIIIVILIATFFLLKKYDYEELVTLTESNETMGNEAGNMKSMGVGEDFSYTDVRWIITGEVKSGKVLCTYSKGLGNDKKTDTILAEREYQAGDEINETIEIGETGLQENTIWLELLEESEFTIYMKMEGRLRGYQILLDKLGLNILSRV